MADVLIVQKVLEATPATGGIDFQGIATLIAALTASALGFLAFFRSRANSKEIHEVAITQTDHTATLSAIKTDVNSNMTQTLKRAEDAAATITRMSTDAVEAAKDTKEAVLAASQAAISATRDAAIAASEAAAAAAKTASDLIQKRVEDFEDQQKRRKDDCDDDSHRRPRPRSR